MFNKVLGAVAAAALTVAPVNARVENGTKPLIDLIDNSGISVFINHTDCASGEYLGLYRHRGMQRAFILCPGESIDADDHMVVRHEAIHAIQHCVNVARGTHVMTPIINDDAKLMAFVRNYLTEEYIQRIQEIYDPTHWRIEFEAFAGMKAYTSDQLAEMFRTACLYTDA